MLYNITVYMRKGENEMQQIKVIELQQVRVGTLKGDFDKNINSPSCAAKILQEYLQNKDREHLVVLVLNTKNKVNAIHTVSIGSLSSAIVHPREVFKPAIIGNGAGIILGHNHPSGDVSPSKEDIDVTNRIFEASNILGIVLLDHIIIGDNQYFSFKEGGYL